MKFIQVNDVKAKNVCQITRINVLNIETPMTATLSDSPAATILYPNDVTTSLNILYVNDSKADTSAESRVLV